MGLINKIKKLTAVNSKSTAMQEVESTAIQEDKIVDNEQFNTLVHELTCRQRKINDKLMCMYRKEYIYDFSKTLKQDFENRLSNYEKQAYTIISNMCRRETKEFISNYLINQMQEWRLNNKTCIELLKSLNIKTDKFLQSLDNHYFMSEKLAIYRDKFGYADIDKDRLASRIADTRARLNGVTRLVDRYTKEEIVELPIMYVNSPSLIEALDYIKEKNPEVLKNITSCQASCAYYTLENNKEFEHAKQSYIALGNRGTGKISLVLNNTKNSANIAVSNDTNIGRIYKGINEYVLEFYDGINKEILANIIIALAKNNLQVQDFKDADILRYYLIYLTSYANKILLNTERRLCELDLATNKQKELTEILSILQGKEYKPQIENINSTKGLLALKKIREDNKANGRIIGYLVSDGKEQRVLKSGDIKRAIRNKTCTFENLTLTSDNRLIMKEV